MLRRSVKVWVGVALMGLGAATVPGQLIEPNQSKTPVPLPANLPVLPAMFRRPPVLVEKGLLVVER